MQRKRHLDGIRIFLFTSVYICHFGIYEFSDIRVSQFLSYALPFFFVMSGFLITNLIMNDSNPSRLGKLKTFYLQRTLRIFPAYYAALFALIAMGMISYPWHALLYIYNINLFIISMPPLSQEELNYMINWRQENLHLWSLSVEEQFYLLFPVLFLITRDKHKILMFALLIVSSMLIRTGFIFYYADSYRAPVYGHLMLVCLEYFAWGGLFAYLEREGKLGSFDAAKIIYPATVLTVLMIGIESYFGLLGLYGQAHPTHFQSLIACFLGIWMWAFWKIEEAHPVARLFTPRIFTSFGKMCYAFYLVHIACAVFAMNLWDEFSWLKTLFPYYVAGFALTMIVGSALWYFVERPFNVYREKLAHSDKH